MTRVLLIGNGAREHAIAAALSKSEVEVHAYMERVNPGIAKISKSYTLGSLTDANHLPDLDGIDYAIIGPEGAIEAGISNFLISEGVPCVAPNTAAARIETSKVFARVQIEKVSPKANPKYVAARSIDDMRKFEKQVGIENIVVKPRGLTGGKGVKIYGEHLQSREQLEDYARNLIINEGVVVLEEKLVGTEFTIQAFSDGLRLEPMPLVRDYKRAYDNDLGPNTGSMGSYSMCDHGLPYVTKTDFESAMQIMNSMLPRIKKKAGSEFKGILYGQFMKTDSGIKVIEFNARFGDPEAMNVLSILETPFNDICESIIDGNLIQPTFEKLATVCVYVVPEGYPGSDTIKDSPIDVSVANSAEIYFASVYEKDNQILTTGSRAIGVLGKGNSVTEAREIAYNNAARIKGRLRYRSDIAK